MEQITAFPNEEQMHRIRAGDLSVPLVSHEPQVCCTSTPFRLNLPPFDDAYPESLRWYHYSPELYADHVRSMNRHLQSAISCWAGCWVSLIPFCTPVCLCLCFKAYLDGGDALRRMRVTMEGINMTLRQNGIPCEWRYEAEILYHESEGENGHQSKHHHFRVYVGRPTLPTQPPPGQAMVPGMVHPTVWQQQQYTTYIPAPAQGGGGVAQGIAIGHPCPPYHQYQAGGGQYPPPCPPPLPQQTDQCAPPPPPPVTQSCAGVPATDTVPPTETTSAPTV